MKNKTLIYTVAVLIFVSMASASAYSFNITQSIDEYSLNQPDTPVVINATVNSSSPGDIKFQTNETGTLQNHSEYIDQVVNQDNQSYVEVTWNDQNDVSTRKPVQYRFKANNSFSENKSFNISFQPIVSNLSITSNGDFTPGQIIYASADVTHPVGRGRINQVTAYWKKPDGETVRYEMRRQNEISNDFTGYIYKSSLGDTVETGAYVLELEVSDNKVNASKKGSFSIERTSEGVQLSPLVIGEASVFDAVGSLAGSAGSIISDPFAEQNLVLSMTLFSLILSVLVTFVVKLGNRGAEVNDFTQ